MNTERLERLVLMVGSDASLRRALERTLRLAGHTVHCYAAVDELLRSPDAARGGCLVLDADAADGSRIDPAQVLRGAAHAWPLILFTAAAEDEDAARFAGVSPVAVLHKPFDRHELIDALERAFAAGTGPAH
jgi:FixJ family two-component response regulator